MITTSCRFMKADNRDPLRILVGLLDDDNVFAVQPSLIIDDGAWKELLRPRKEGLTKKSFWIRKRLPVV